MSNQYLFNPFAHVRLCILLLFIPKGTSGATVTFINSCDYTIWPGVLSNSGSQGLGTTGFQLAAGVSRSFQAPAGWSGRFWGRTSCNFDSSGKRLLRHRRLWLRTARVQRRRRHPASHAHRARHWLRRQPGLLRRQPRGRVQHPSGTCVRGRRGECIATGCVADLNKQCPPELRFGEMEACRSACDAFGRAEYCCSGEFSSPATCRPSKYSEVFKAACPRSYSYAFNDATSTFTCEGADYHITFCPKSTSQKSWKESPRTEEAGYDGVVIGNEHHQYPSLFPGLVISVGSRNMMPLLPPLCLSAAIIPWFSLPL